MVETLKLTVPRLPDEPAATWRDRAMELIRHTYVMDLTDRPRLAQKLDRVSRDCVAIDIRRLVYPRELAALPRVETAILEDLRRS